MPLFPAPLPIPWIIGDEAVNSASSSGVLGANTSYLYAFELQATTTITSLSYRMAATVGGTTDMGIYDVNGNLLGHTGVITNVANATVTTAFSLALSPGLYYLALCPSNSTDTYQRLPTPANIQTLLRSRLGINNGTAGVLPATLGGTQISANAPQMAAHVSGGLP